MVITANSTDKKQIVCRDKQTDTMFVIIACLKTIEYTGGVHKAYLYVIIFFPNMIIAFMC